MKHCTRLALILACSWWATGAPAASDAAPSPDARGLAIAEEMARREEGFGDSTAELRMTLTNNEGQERVRRLTWKTLEAIKPGEGDKSLTVFHEPRDIEGTAFLSHTYIDREDDQWLYLPSLKRVKRIASVNKSGSFVGSEFAYEDLLSDEVEKFDYLWLRDEACGNWQCFVIERRPRYRNSGYSRQIVWVDRNEYRPVRIEYYDTRDRLEKVLTLTDYQLHEERWWRAHTLRMTSELSGKSTLLTFSDIQFRTGLSPRDFDPGALRLLR